jgi:hypothetical protein
MTVLAGVVGVSPESTPTFGIRVSSSTPQGEPVGFHVEGAEPLPAEGDVTAVAEASLAQVVVEGTTNHDVAYGVGDVAVQLVADDANGGQRSPYLSFLCYGDRPLAVRYRVTLLQPVTR